MTTMYDQLMQLPLFQGLSNKQMTHILEVIPFEFRTFRQDEVISLRGMECRGVTFLLSGSIRVETPIFNQRVKITQVFETPYNFSLHHLFGADIRAHSTMYAASPKTGIMLLRKADFLRILNENEVTLINTLNMLCTRAQKQHKAIDFSGETDPILKLASWILAFTERSAKEATFVATEHDWSEMLQLDIPSFWRCVAVLEGQHMLESYGGTLKLLDRYALRTLVGTKTT